MPASSDLSVSFHFCCCLSTWHCLPFYVPSSNENKKILKTLFINTLLVAGRHGCETFSLGQAFFLFEQQEQLTIINYDQRFLSASSPLPHHKIQTLQTPAKLFHPRHRHFNTGKINFHPHPFFFSPQGRIFPLFRLLTTRSHQSMNKATNSVYCHMNYTELDRDFVRIWQALQWKV